MVQRSTIDDYMSKTSTNSMYDYTQVSQPVFQPMQSSLSPRYNYGLQDTSTSVDIGSNSLLLLLGLGTLVAITAIAIVALTSKGRR